MKKFIAILSAAVLACAILSVIPLTNGCVHTPTVTYSTDTNGVISAATNIVTSVDTNKLQQVQALVEPAAASAIRRAIKNSPQHAQEIGDYARAVGKAMCKSVGSQQISPAQVIGAVEVATQNLQVANLPPEVIDAKNALIAVYTVLWNDKLTVQLPSNQWPYAVLQTICDTLDLALKDSGQVGIK